MVCLVVTDEQLSGVPVRSGDTPALKDEEQSRSVRGNLRPKDGDCAITPTTRLRSLLSVTLRGVIAIS